LLLASQQGTALIRIDRMRHIAATPQAVFAALSDPSNLAGLMPRVRRVELVERQANRARIATQMAIGPFTDIRSEGDVRWQTDREIVFSSRRPVAVEARWTLTPSGGGTDVQAALSLDLEPLIGPFAAFVPQKDVAKMVGPDLEAALAEIARRVERGQ
jgi:carbon monoxide dehydrogenase subunit G